MDSHAKNDAPIICYDSEFMDMCIVSNYILLLTPVNLYVESYILWIFQDQKSKLSSTYRSIQQSLNIKYHTDHELSPQVTARPYYYKVFCHLI